MGAMMAMLKNSAMPIRICVGGMLWVPSALRKNVSTIEMRINDVVTSKQPGPRIGR